MIKPSVSVICAFFNEERFLAEAIGSVLSQSWSDLELILVDDGSTDGSRMIANMYQAKDQRVRVVEHLHGYNCGLSASRNLGISIARAPYLTFIDGDDRWPSAKLSEQVAVMELHPEIALLAGAARYWRSWAGGLDEVRQVGKFQDEIIRPPKALLSTYPIGSAEAPGTTGFMVTADAIARVGGFESSFRGMYEDQAFLVKIYLNENVYFSSACWFDYRQHDTSMLARSIGGGDYLNSKMKFFRWFLSYLKTQDVAPPIRRQVQREWFKLRLLSTRKTFRELLRQPRLILRGWVAGG